MILRTLAAFGRITPICVTAAMLISAVPAETAPIMYDCDTAAGAYSMLELTQPGPEYRVSGRISAVQFRKARQWFPVANVRLVSADKKNVIGLRIQRETYTAPVELVLQSYLNGRQKDTVLQTLQKGDVVPFVIKLMAGRVIVRAAGRDIPSDVVIGANATVHISCSTGQFLFQELDWAVPDVRISDPQLQ